MSTPFAPSHRSSVPIYNHGHHNSTFQNLHNSTLSPVPQHLTSHKQLTADFPRPAVPRTSSAQTPSASHLLSSELVVDPVQLLELDAMRDHLQRINVTLLDQFEQLFPVHVHRPLSVADEADTMFHQRADAEVVSLRVLVGLLGVKMRRERSVARNTHESDIHPRCQCPKFLTLIISLTISDVSVSIPSIISK